jgi:WD40 repeat protein
MRGRCRGPGKTFLSVDGDGVLAWVDPNDATLLNRVQAHTGSANQVSCSDSGTAVTCSRDRSIKVWTVNDSFRRTASRAIDDAEPRCARPSAHSLNISAVAISADGSVVASGSKDTTVRLWDVNRELAPLAKTEVPRNTITCLTLMPDSSIGRCVVVQGSEDLQVRVWDARSSVSTGGLMMSLHSCLQGYVYFPLAVDVHPNGRYVLTSSRGVAGVGGEARVWDLRMPSVPLAKRSLDTETHHGLDGITKGAHLGEFLGHEEDATGCVWVPPAACRAASMRAGFLTASKDRTVRLWSLEDESDGSHMGELGESSECCFRHVDGAAGAFSCIAWLGEDSMDAVVGNTDGSVRVLRLGAGKELTLARESEATVGGD